MKNLRISILDQSIIREGGTPREALNETVELAKLGDRLGFRRFWVAEHHNMPLISSASPEILIAKIAENTSRIRVGAGGIMLPNYSPLKVAEWFRMLEALYPNRIDLGLGRATGSDPMTASLLNPNNGGADSFPTKLQHLQGFLYDRIRTRMGEIIAAPRIPTVPQQWVLTGSANAELAGQNGLGLALPQFVTPLKNSDGIKAYRAAFKPSERFPRSKVMMAIFAVVAETEEKARLIRKAMEITSVLARTKGQFLPVKTLEDADAHQFADREKAFLKLQAAKIVSGTPEQVADQLHALAEKFDLDEIMVSMFAHSWEDKKRNYELLAEVMIENKRPPLRAAL